MYRVLNRANARMTIFHKPEDYAAFERVLEEAVERFRPVPDTFFLPIGPQTWQTHDHCMPWPFRLF